MGFLNFGRKKKNIADSAGLVGAPPPEEQPPLPTDSMSNPSISQNNDQLSSQELSIDPSTDIPTLDSVDEHIDVDEPVPLQDPVSLDSMQSQENQNQTSQEAKPSDDSFSEPEQPSQPENYLASLPEFSEDDFSAPKPPVTSDIPSVENILVPPVNSAPASSNDPTSLFSPAKQSSSYVSSQDPSYKKSYAASQGVFIHRTAYISLLSSLDSSSKDLKSLLAKQKHLIDFDSSTKKLLDSEANESEKLHKKILAIMPFISKK